MTNDAAIRQLQVHIQAVDVLKGRAQTPSERTLADALSEALEWIVSQQNDLITLTASRSKLEADVEELRRQVGRLTHGS